MATISNPFRRKQDAILGVDLSNQHSRPTSQASFGSLSGSDTGVARRRIAVRKVGTIPAQITQFQQIPEHRALTPDPVADREDDGHSLADIRREIESVYNGSDYHDSYTLSPTSDTHDPFDEDEGTEDDEEEEYDSLEDDMSMYAGSVLPRRRLHKSKRMAELRNDSSSVRSSSALGFRSSSTDSTALPSKAERMLGMAPKRAHSTALHPAPRVSKSKKGGLAPKAQRLLGVRADTIKKSARLQHEKGFGDGHGSATTAVGPGSDVEDFKKLLLAGRSRSFARKQNPESVSDASSMSRSSMMDSQTSRSSRELLSPDADTPTWTSPNSAAPPWLGVHPAFRKKASVDSETFSPISPHTVLGGGSPHVPSYANFNSLHDAHSQTFGAVELDAGPIGPPSPVELAAPDSDMIARSVPTNVHEMSSMPPSPKQDRPRTGDNRLGKQRSSSSLLATSAYADRPASADDAESPTLGLPRRQERPSAIFNDPNIFEMPADVPETSTRPQLQGMNTVQSPPTPPPSARSIPTKSSRLNQSTTASPPPSQSPYAPPQRPLPALPAQHSTSGTSIHTGVDFAAARTRHPSDDSMLSPHTATDTHSLHSQPSMSSLPSEDAPPLTALSVPSPLAMALAEGKPITKDAPPPLLSPDNYPPTKRQLAAQAEKRRVELSDKDGSARPANPAKKKLADLDAESIHRPFSWQSTRSTRTMRSGTESEGAGAEPSTSTSTPATASTALPAKLPPLALTIPSDAVRKAASHHAPSSRSGAMTATPLTATSARSRASRLEKALESALSKDGMDKALSGEKIEYLFRSAGAEELFVDVSKESRELIGLEPGEDTEEARQAGMRAQELLKDLGELQDEVDQLRRLYEEGGPLEGLEGLEGMDLRGGVSTI